MKQQANREFAIVEHLEDRRLLNGAGPHEPVWLADRQLMIKGTQAPDTIVISAYQYPITTTLEDGSTTTSYIDKIKVLFNSRQFLFHADQVKRIVVNARAGDDSVVVDASGGPMTKPLHVITGKGHDTALGGAGNDKLWGELGDDSIDGGGGDDMLSGGAGNDSMLGGDGSDKILGGAGDDNLDGGLGDDRVSGQQGNDDLTGGEGADILSGGAGNDDFLGGANDAQNEIKDQRKEDDGDNVLKIKKKKVHEQPD